MSAELQLVEGPDDIRDEVGLTGATIDGRYEVEKVLGEGGMGLVYKARHIILNKPLAIKVLRPDVSRDEEIITRFRQEAQSASAIGNQHIIDISDFGILPDKSTYFVMEFLDGIDLTGAIEGEEDIESPIIIHIAKQLCRALGAAHEAGIVHRDLKPDNIYLIRRGGDSNFVKVLDFGIAKVGGNSSKLTRAGQVFGTPHYMSPEQCAGSGVDHRTDVYALGVILYEMCTGQCPFDADNLMGILTKHLYEEAVPPRQLNGSIHVELELVILKAMAKKLDERYQSMAELLEDLERLEAGVGTVARETTRAVALHTPEAPTKSKIGLIVVAIAALLAAGIGMGLVLTGEPEVPPVVLTPPELPIEEPIAATVEPEPIEEPVLVPVARVTVETVPDGAELRMGSVVICNTPCDIDRPADGETAELTLSKSGFGTETRIINSLTAGPLTIELQSTRSTSRPSMRVRMTVSLMEPEVTMVPVMTPVTMMRPTMRGTTEVLNPWDNDPI
ncbi:MAG: putative Ser/Thr protein kinase [Polyangiales bacterium]|jgi:predicted Ser/Thr protein kinase